jgi:hypothetical protein
VPTNLETQEALTDWALDRMGLAEGGGGGSAGFLFVCGLCCG